MKLLVYTPTKDYNQELAVSLIPKGIEPIVCDTYDEALKLLEKDNSILTYLCEYEDTEKLKNIKSLYSQLFIFLLTNQNLKPSDFVELSKYGINSLINSSVKIQNIADEISETIIIKKLRPDEKRFHVRVQPKPYEEIIASVLIKNYGKFIKGRVIDISAGGIAMKVSDSIEASMLNINDLYEKAFVNMPNGEVKCSFTLVGKRNDIAAFKFNNIEQHYMNILARYIHDSITESSKQMIEQMMTEQVSK